MAVMQNSIIFGGINSADFGIYIGGEGVFNAPKRAVEMVTVPGRNGDIAIDQGHYENIEVTYSAFNYEEDLATFAKNLSDFRNAIASQVGYQRLTDTFHPDEYRMAIYTAGLEIDPIKYNTASEFDLKFDCKPQRWLTSGEIPVTIGEWGATKTASGEIVTIESEGGEAAKSLVVTLEPIQSGSGDPSPDNVRPISGRTEVVTHRTGKNKLYIPDQTYTSGGLTFTSKDGIITITGTKTSSGAVSKRFNATVPTGSYIYNASNNSAMSNTYYTQFIYNGGTWADPDYYGRDISVDITATSAQVYVACVGDMPSGGITFKPMLRFASETDATFEPYNGNTYTTSLGRTVYGGTLDVASGVLTVDKVMLEWLSSSNFGKGGATTVDEFFLRPSLAGVSGSWRDAEHIICSHAKNVESTSGVTAPYTQMGSGQPRIVFPLSMGMSLANFKTWLDEQQTNGTPLQVCYMLATPQTYQLTPQQVTLLLGENHVWSDGAITMQYGDDPNSLWNPTQYDAGPLLAIEGNGTVQLGQSRLDVSDGILGTYVVAENHQFVTTVRYWGSSLEIDPYFNSGDKFSLGKVEVTELIEDTNGNIFTEVSNISLSEGTSVSFEGNTLRIRTVFDYGEFTVGSGYTNRSREISFDVKNASGKIDTATFGIGFTYSNLGDLFVSGYITSVVPASGSTGFDFSANYLYSSVVAKKISGFSTRSVGSLTKYVDCETGESYVMLGDRIISNNRNISLPVDLPVLTSGANAISFSNTITDLKITPRWWKL